MKPNVIIVIQSGMVQRVMSDSPEALPFEKVTVVDYDIDGSVSTDLIAKDGSTERVCLSHEYITESYLKNVKD